MTENMVTQKQLVERYAPILEGKADVMGEDFAPITNPRIKAITAQLLENQIKSIRAGEQEVRTQLVEDCDDCLNTTSVAGWTGVLIKLVRRAIPQLCAHELVGVQPMRLPTGQIFSYTPIYANKEAPNNVALNGAPDTAYTGWSSDGTDGWDQGTGVAPDGTGPNPGGPVATDYEEDPWAAAGFTTGTAMDPGKDGCCITPKMSLKIESVQVTAKMRAFCACYSPEVAHDMQVMHGLDAEAELARDMANELAAEINEEIRRTILKVAKVGAQDTTTPGVFDLSTDSSGRYTEERMRDLLFRIELEANKVAFETHAGKANWVLVTAGVAAALSMMGIMSAGCCDKEQMLDVNGPLSCFAGTLPNGMKVFIDPYTQNVDYFVVGLKVSDQHAGLYYAPYVPFQVIKGQADCNGNPQLFFRSRYGMVQNPFVKDANGTPLGMNMADNSNPYFRKVLVRNLTA